MNQNHRHFAEELSSLRVRLLAMGGLAEERLRIAVRALVDRNHDSLADVIAGDARIDDLQIEIDDRCFTLLALYQPVASDLRTVVSVLKINADVERVGDFAVNIGEVARRYLTHPPVKPLIDLPRMAELALKMFREVLTYMLGDSRTIEPGIDLILIARHLERVGDHATNIAEDVIFIVEGRDVRHRSASLVTPAAPAVIGSVVDRRRNFGKPPA